MTAVINYSKVQKVTRIADYIALNIGPDATTRNWSGYGNKIAFGEGVDVMNAFKLLPDPQTNGGLLVAVAPEDVVRVQSIFHQLGLGKFAEPIGVLVAKQDKVVVVQS